MREQLLIQQMAGYDYIIYNNLIWEWIRGAGAYEYSNVYVLFFPSIFARWYH